MTAFYPSMITKGRRVFVLTFESNQNNVNIFVIVTDIETLNTPKRSEIN